MLHKGLRSAAGRDVAENFSLEDAARSMLAPQATQKDPGWKRTASAGTEWLEKNEGRLHAPLYITGVCSSILDISDELCRRGLFPPWSGALALSQNSGRGQMRRVWHSPAGNLYAALRLPMEGPFSGTAAAPAIGALFAEALFELGCDIRLKWPNDLVQAEKGPGSQTAFRKVGGILLEEKNGALNAGIGINLASCPDTGLLRGDHALPAGILRLGKEEGPGEKFVSIFTLWVNLADVIFSCYNKKCSQKTWWVSLTEKHLAFKGCRIALAGAVPEFSVEEKTMAEGILEGIEPSGALRLRTPYGTETFLGGSMMPSLTMPCLE